MINSKPNYSIEAYETSDNAREIYSSIRKRTITQRIDDRTFCLCQSIFETRKCDHEEEHCQHEPSEGSYGCYGPNCGASEGCGGFGESCNAPHN